MTETVIIIKIALAMYSLYKCFITVDEDSILVSYMYMAISIFLLMIL